ncbi:glycosyltransferase family 2 protein [Roseofilum sp. BLCC_M154]|uniref:Glycosyltransferase family 2 protein n=1 Tax=Roseofilum acuticapitatum BLCC-M154 TaxID=3022444 RepID=A0ABT7ARG2_9CYAN|nr:glycosyltransferase family 2 protein [Roseofilum acuticapitatum]MDJ1169009.1 glycosyltransferase family 2 protein [Roseofilum acuticapitatum BLCC-M154]
MSDKTQPLVSIIIPAYKATTTIASTVESLINQTYTHWEAAIASDDNLDYLALLAQQGITDPRIKQTFTGSIGNGEAVARNAAVQISNGEILANLDADDAYSPNRLQELVPLALEYGAAIDNTGVYNTELILYKQPFPKRNTLTFATPDDILQPRVPFFPVFQRQYLGTGWTKVPFAADVLFNLELLSRIQKVAIHPQPLYQYYKRENSITQSTNAFETAERAYQQILALLAEEKFDLTPEIRQAANDEFSQNLLLNRLFRQYMESGRCQNLEQFLDLTENGHAHWLKPELESVTLQIF